MSIAKSIEEMILQRSQTGPQMIKDYGSSLETAATQDQQSIDQLRGIYSDPSKFNRSAIGAFGLGLMAPNNGNFTSSMRNALGAAIDTQNYNREQNLSREEKLAKLSALQAELTRQKANDTIGVYDKQTSWMTNAQTDQKTLSDLQLSGGLPGAEGTDPMSRSMEIYNDYLANPTKYAGPQGQAMVDDAITFIKNERNAASREKIAQARIEQKSAPKPLTVKDKTMIGEAEDQNAILKNTLADLDEASKIGDKTWSGPFANQRAKLTSWWYGNEGVDDTTADEHLRYQQIMEGEAIKQMSATLKGATTDREMQKFIDIVADPSVPWNATKKYALERVKRFATTLQDLNNERISGIRDGSYWTGETGQGEPDTSPDLGFDPQELPDDVKAWVQEQLDGGADEEQVLEYLRENFGRKEE